MNDAFGAVGKWPRKTDEEALAMGRKEGRKLRSLARAMINCFQHRLGKPDECENAMMLRKQTRFSSADKNTFFLEIKFTGSDLIL